jgi:hypothetical protein
MNKQKQRGFFRCSDRDLFIFLGSLVLIFMAVGWGLGNCVEWLLSHVSLTWS